MDCFEVQNRLTESIDGALGAQDRSAFDSHLKGCPTCSTHQHRLRELVTLLQNSSRVAIPPELRQDPLSFKLPKIQLDRSPKALWKGLPVWVRLLVEGLAIACVVTLGIQVGPRIRSFYEQKMDQRLQTMIAAEDLSNEGLVPLSRGKTDPEAAGGDVDFASGDSDDHADDTPEEVSADPNIRVGRSEIWRFNLKTDSPPLVRSQIMKVFADTGIPSTTPGFGGTEAPGGIQFDLIVPQSAIPALKAQLEKLAAPSPNQQPGDTPFSETFTWYKNRSKKPIPGGTSRVVIWLSQI